MDSFNLGETKWVTMLSEVLRGRTSNGGLNFLIFGGPGEHGPEVKEPNEDGPVRLGDDLFILYQGDRWYRMAVLAIHEQERSQLEDGGWP